MTTLWSAQAQEVIRLRHQNGVYLIPCVVNGLSLEFIFDTGASEVSLSTTEARFMLKNGYLSDSDFTGTASYRVASGEIHEGLTLNIRSLKIGGRELRNISATVVKDGQAPLLLGQSALTQLGDYHFDFAKETLIFSNPIAAPRGSTQSDAGKTQDFVRCADGSVCLTARIGAQVWTTNNLMTDQFANGDRIPQIQSAIDWRATIGPAICYYDNDISIRPLFGGLYNWSAITDPRGLCPRGWHVPTDADWMILERHLGMPQSEISAEGVLPATLRGSDANIGGKLAMASWLWNEGKGHMYPSGASGFDAIPGGFRMDALGAFRSMGQSAMFWTSSRDEKGNPIYRVITFDQAGIGRISPIPIGSLGLSCRCVRDF
ncbi:MAG: retroviral-like aspartic protease family protein [Flavobacteriales bacterium]|nr:retroviral-like aspartic protease family protein [Flavobacteriales bacterium]